MNIGKVGQVLINNTLTNAKKATSNATFNIKTLLNIAPSEIKAGENLGDVFLKTIDKNGKVVKSPVKVSVEFAEKPDGGVFKLYDSSNEYVGKGWFGFLKRKDKDKFSSITTESFSKLGLTGNKIYIKYLENAQPEKYSGVASLLEKTIIEYCLRKNLNPKVVFNAGANSHVAHFKRGARFLPCKTKEGLLIDINKLVKNIIAVTPDGSKCRTDGIGLVPAYLPKEKIQEYIAQILRNPVLKIQK